MKGPARSGLVLGLDLGLAPDCGGYCYVYANCCYCHLGLLLEMETLLEGQMPFRAF